MPLKRYITDATASRHSTCFRFVVQQFQAQPLLRRWIKTWATWDGQPEGVAEPDVTAGAWARLTPVTEGFELDSESTTDAPLGIKIEVCVPGTCVDDLMDLWAAFIAACYPGDGSFLAGLDAAGGYGYRIKTGPYQEVTLQEGLNLAGTGLFVCYVKLDTAI